MRLLKQFSIDQEDHSTIYEGVMLADGGYSTVSKAVEEPYQTCP